LKVLVTGGSVGDVPVIESLVSSNHYVLTSGNLEGDPGHKFSHEYHKCDYTDVDGLINICLSESVEAIVPSSHDLAAVAASKVASRLGLPGHDAVDISLRIHNKDLLRRAMRAADCEIPAFFDCNNLETLRTKNPSLTYPVIVKPVDLTGGNGISVCNDSYGIERAFERAQSESLSKNVIVEEFLSGTYHGLSTLIKNQKVIFSFFDDEFYFFDQFRVSATSYPSSLTEDEKHSGVEQLERLAAHLRLEDGLLHSQILRTESKLVIIEVCRRTPGDLYPTFVSISTGVDYAAMITQSFLGEKSNIAHHLENDPKHGVLRLMLMPKKRGTFTEIVGGIPPEFHSKFLWRKSGEFVMNPRKWTAGIYFFTSKSTFSCSKIEEILDSYQVVIS
jgi:biotin carboxylase